tara:strand:- start:136765 stop:137094 length:330 start_codon:yes stop_codon:yes gene_type:complete
MSEQEVLLNNIIEKWDHIQFAINKTIQDEEMNNYIRNVSEKLNEIKSENFERESFDIVETYIVLLESRLDEMVADNEIPKKLWALINSSIYNFNVYLSYLMVNSIKIKK